MIIFQLNWEEQTLSLKCFMHLLFRCLSTLSLYCHRNQTYILALPDAHKLHWSSDIGAQSRSISTTLPVRSVKLIFDFVTVRMMSLQPLTASSSSPRLWALRKWSWFAGWCSPLCDLQDLLWPRSYRWSLHVCEP